MPWAIALACGAAARSGRADAAESAETSPPDSFRWRSSYREALEAANAARTPLLVYFPPVAEPDPAAIGRAERALGSPPRAQGARVGADDVAELVDRFGIQDVPCLLLVDRSETVIARWTGAIPSGAWRLIDSAIRALERREAEYRRILDRAGEEVESGEAESAYRRISGLLETDGVPSDVVAEARGVERRLQDDVRRQVLSVLAGERLVEDSRLVEGLEEIRDRTAHAGLREEILAEIQRIQAGTIPGEPTDLRPLRRESEARVAG